MANRRLRIVKESPPPVIGVCERCNVQFKSSQHDALADIAAQYESHKCKLVDSSQNALRIVQDSTEGK
jgi:hypothetical protein